MTRVFSTNFVDDSAANKGLQPTASRATAVIDSMVSLALAAAEAQAVGRTAKEMRFDLRVRYEKGNLIVQSKAAHHGESFTAIVCLSRATDSIEQVYSVGVPPDEVKRGLSKDFVGTTASYRFIDPFSSTSFDGDIASKAVAYLCTTTRKRLFPKREWWWRVIGNSRSTLAVEIPGYSRLPESARAEFEAGLKRFVGRAQFAVAG